MKVVVLMCLLFLTINANLLNVNQNISKTSKKIKNAKMQYSSIYTKMKKNVHDIFAQENLIIQQQVQLRFLSNGLQIKRQSYNKNKEKLKIFKQTQFSLKKNQANIQQKLIFAIAKVASFSTIVDTKSEENIQSLMSHAIIKILIKLAKKQIKSLNKKFLFNNSLITYTQKIISNLQAKIDSIDMKKKLLIKIKHTHELSLLKLKQDKLKYKLALEKLLRQQHALQKTLSKLNIIKINKIKLIKIQKYQHVMLHRKINTKLLNVKKIGSSYRRVRTTKYRGIKTITPLKSFIITKRYGPYVDPIYKIKIFNESVWLQSKIKNAKVRTIFNGKVIFSKNTPLLKKIVIMQNKNGIHTIYANLSQIAPGIKVGRKLRKSAVIGRVQHRLVFEVTKRNYHINPLELFK